MQLQLLFKILIESSQEEEDDEADGGTSYQFENELASQASLDGQTNDEEEPDSYLFVQVNLLHFIYPNASSDF